MASKHTSQHRAISSAQVALGLIKSLVAPNHGLLLSAPFTFRCIFPVASVAGGASRPRSGALVHIYTLVARSRISSKLILSSCVILRSRVLRGVHVLVKDIVRRLPLVLASTRVAGRLR